MKLRILGNKLRFRLTQNEVKELSNGLTVSDSVDFPIGESLIYSVASDEKISEMSASYQEEIIRVMIPAAALKNWKNDDREGVYHTIQSEIGPFEIAVEKDFKCLHKRPGEDETDNYPNPMEAKHS
ncbi:MAG: hypothetical protein AAFQ94_22535 [Bacteroidota bacterium]